MLVKAQGSKVSKVDPALAYLGSLAKGSQRTMRECLVNIAELVKGEVRGWHELRYAHTQAIPQRLLEQGKSYKTVNKHLAALRGVLKQCWQLDLISAEDYHKAVSVKNVKGESVLAGRVLNVGEISALIQVCKDNSPGGTRDAALIALLYSGGIRRAEAASALFEAFSPITGELIVKGKGNKQRIVYLVNGALRAMNDWLEVRGLWDGALFCPVDKGGNVKQKGLSTQDIYNMLKRRGAQAGISDFSPHDMRRTFVTHLLEKGADYETVRRMAGHANIETTRRYDRRGEEAKAKAAELLHVPY